jgi:hypothetical protein
MRGTTMTAAGSATRIVMLSVVLRTQVASSAHVSALKKPVRGVR